MSELAREFVFTEADGRRAHALWRLSIAALSMTLLGIVALVVIQLSPLPNWYVLRPVGLFTAAVTTVLIIARFFDPGRSLDRYGLDVDASWVQEAAAGFILAVAVTGFPTLLAVAAGWYDLVAVVPHGFGDLLLGGMMALGYTFLVALWEELFFRGVVTTNAIELVGNVSRTLALPGGVLLGAWWFATIHEGHPDRPILILTWFLAGVVFTVLYLATGRLALPTGAHAGYNSWHVLVADRTSDAPVVTETPELAAFEPTAGALLVGPGGLVDVAAFVGILFVGLAWVRLYHGRVANRWLTRVSRVQKSIPTDDD